MRAVLSTVVRTYGWRWLPAPALALGAASAGAIAWRSGTGGGAGTAVAMLVALPLVFSVEDDLAVICGPSPTTWRARVMARLAVVGLGCALAWCGAQLLAAAGSAPVALGLLEAVTLALVGVAAALAGMSHGTDPHPASAGASAILAAALVGPRLPEPLAFYPVEDHRGRWLALAWACCAAVCSATRDPLDR